MVKVTCDICGREVTDVEREPYHFILPCILTDIVVGRLVKHRTKDDFDLCTDCAERIDAFVSRMLDEQEI